MEIIKNTMITNNTIRSDCQSMSRFCFMGTDVLSEKTKIAHHRNNSGF